MKQARLSLTSPAQVVHSTGLRRYWFNLLARLAQRGGHAIKGYFPENRPTKSNERTAIDRLPRRRRFMQEELTDCHARAHLNRDLAKVCQFKSQAACEAGV